MIQITNEERAVLNFLKIKQAENIAAGKLKEGDTNIIWNSLRLESSALATQGSVSFACNADDQSVPESATELRLEKVDSFCITRIGMYIMRYTTASGRQTGRFRTYPNPNIFTAAGEADALQSLYNAKLDIMVNRKLYYPQLDTQQHYMVPIMPEKTGTVTAPVATYAAGIDRDSLDNNNGMIDFIPSCTLFGGNTNQIEITLPANAAMAAAAGSTNIVVLMLRGFLMTNWNAEQLNLQL